jgi:hypothetical protein
VLEADKLEVVADRGYFNGEEILACEQADITVTLPKPLRSGAKSQGRFGKQDFVYLPENDVYRCPAGEHLKYYFTATEHGQQLRRYCAGYSDACMRTHPRAPAGGVREAPRREIAGGGALAVQQALWGFGCGRHHGGGGFDVQEWAVPAAGRVAWGGWMGGKGLEALLGACCEARVMPDKSSRVAASR